MTGRHVAVDPATEGHDHRPVQHRDGKPPWCPVCKLTADGSVPQSRLRPPVTGSGRGRSADSQQARPPRGGAGGSQPGRLS